MMESENAQTGNNNQTSGVLATLEILLKFFAVLYFPSVLAGRLYKQWYYAAFGISFEELELTQFEYILSSGTIWLSVFSLIFITWNLYTSFRQKGSASLIISLTIVFIALLLEAFWPFHFDPGSNLLTKMIGSKDIIWWVLGLVSLVSLDRLRHQRYRLSDLKKNNIIYELIEKCRLLLADFPSFATLLLVIVGLLVVIGYWQASYQAHAAIDEGKMGLVNTVYHGREWHRLNIGSRVYLFDPASKTTILYNEDAALPSQPFRKLP